MSAIVTSSWRCFSRQHASFLVHVGDCIDRRISSARSSPSFAARENRLGRWWQGAHQGTPPGFAVVTLDGERVESRYVAYV